MKAFSVGLLDKWIMAWPKEPGVVITKHYNHWKATINYAHLQGGLEQYLQWLEQNFGPGGNNKKCLWRVRWRDVINANPHIELYLKSERVVTEFALRWQ